jgi:hypothetical protein
VQLGKLPVPPGTEVPPGHVYVESDVPLAPSLVVMVVRYADGQGTFFAIVIVHLIIVGGFQSFRLLQQETD